VEGYRRFWERSEERYGRLDDYLREAQRAQRTQRKEEEADDQRAP